MLHTCVKDSMWRVFDGLDGNMPSNMNLLYIIEYILIRRTIPVIFGVVSLLDYFTFICSVEMIAHIILSLFSTSWTCNIHPSNVTLYICKLNLTMFYICNNNGYIGRLSVPLPSSQKKICVPLPRRVIQRIIWCVSWFIVWFAR